MSDDQPTVPADDRPGDEPAGEANDRHADSRRRLRQLGEPGNSGP